VNIEIQAVVVESDGYEFEVYSDDAGGFGFQSPDGEYISDGYKSFHDAVTAAWDVLSWEPDYEAMTNRYDPDAEALHDMGI